MHTVFALLCFVVVIHRLIFPYPSGLLHWHCGNLTIAPVPAKQPWWIWINTSFEFIMNDYITTKKQSTTKPCAYFLGYTVSATQEIKAASRYYGSYTIFHDIHIYITDLLCFVLLVLYAKFQCQFCDSLSRIAQVFCNWTGRLRVLHIQITGYFIHANAVET